MVQVSDKVGTAQKGSMKAVAGSGMASMSEASMDFQPRMEEPSKPKPSEKTSSVNSENGTLKCCQVPKVSTNLTSTIFAPCLRAISITLLGLLILSCCRFILFHICGQAVPVRKKSRGDRNQTASSPDSSVRMRVGVSTLLRKTLPSPILPARAA